MELNTEEPGLEPETALEPELEAAQPEPAPQPTPEPAPAAPAAPAEQEGPFWYRKAVQKERQRVVALEREIEQLRSQRPAPEPLPHLLDDPDGFQERVFAQLRADREQGRLEQSEFFARNKHGDDLVDEVNDWLMTRPDIVEGARRTRDPWSTAIQQYRREKLAAEIGDDPAAYRAKVEAELRASIAAEHQQSALATQPQPANTPPRIPTPASAQRSVQPRDGAGRYAGPAPLTDLFNRKRGGG